MIINLDNVSKRYTKTWVLKNVNYTFQGGVAYGVSGSNGSGKSTLLKMLSGFLSPTIGKISFDYQGNQIDRSEIYKMVSYAAPYVAMPPMLTLSELVQFHFKFKSLSLSGGVDEFYNVLQLPVPDNSKIAELSSGQVQRIHLALSILSSSEILLLDEPSSYLDEQSVQWFQDLLEAYGEDRLVVISSNHAPDLSYCSEHLDVADYH